MNGSLNKTWRKQVLNSGEIQTSSGPSEFPHRNSILTAPCPVAAARCAFESVSSNALRPATWVQASQTKLNPNGPLLRLRLRSFKSTLLPNFNTIDEREFPIMGGQQPEDTFSTYESALFA